MFGFFKKRKHEAQNGSVDWSFLNTDLHSHFIPGIDDGPATMQESLALLQQMSDSGFTRLITTPHISADYFPNTRDQILAGLDLLRVAVADAGIPLQIEAAAEYMIDERFIQLLRQQEPLLYFGDRYVLVEMGFVQPAPMLQQAIFELQALGYRPVLAHPERYPYYHKTALEEISLLKEAGCHLQLNTIALSGYYGKDVNIYATRILKAGLYDFAGSDIHHERHLKAFNSVLRNEASALVKNYSFINKRL